MNPEPHFNGPAYNPELDFVRLTGQIKRIFTCMADNQWRTLREIANITGDGEASISAQLRHLKKERFGSHGVIKERRGDPKNGLWQYKLIPTYSQQKLEI